MPQEYITITPRNLALPTARFLSADEEAKYKEIVNEKYSSEKARNNLNVQSNLFKVIELQNQGINVATLSDLGLIAEQHRDWISGFYIDAPAVVLRSAGDSYLPNDFLAKDLAKQLSRKRKFPNPLVVTGLALEESAESDYGLRLVETDKTKFYQASELNHANHQKRFSKTDERGIPIFDKNGDRTLYTKGNGLSRLDVSGGSGLYSNWYDLADSDSDGRVVVVDTEGVARENLDALRAETEKLLAKQEKERADLIARLKQ